LLNKISGFGVDAVAAVALVVEVVGVVKENESVECVVLADGVYGGVVGAVVTIGKANESAEGAFVAADTEEIGTVVVVESDAVVAK
jgi:hypothetical protein